MNWLNKIVDQLIKERPDKEIIVSSGVSPSGTYHLGTLREVLTAEVILRELKMRGKAARHVHVSDDLDVFRKVPVNVSDEFEKYLGMPLCDVPSPDKTKASTYADYFIADLLAASEGLRLDMEIIRAHEKYRNGDFTEAIEKSLSGIVHIRNVLEQVSGRKLDSQWSPVQVIEDGYLKTRKFISFDAKTKILKYADKEGVSKDIKYDDGKVKLNWRIDWPARWRVLGVDAEPFGRDHATKGGSYDTGVAIADKVFGVKAPLPIPYNFINKTGETKKMSKSKGDAVTASELLEVLPTEIVWFFMLRYSPDKLLFFDTAGTLISLFDDFSELLSKTDKTEQEEHLLKLCLHGVKEQTISRVPFTHLHASFQASLRDVNITVESLKRTEYAKIATEDKDVIKRELKFIEKWLDNWAPEESKFELLNGPADASEFTQKQIEYLLELSHKISVASPDADGEWFHKAIYEFKQSMDIEAKELFTTLYKVLIGKQSGPRAGWFLSILPRDWLVKQLKVS